jgi:hypothetical protein
MMCSPISKVSGTPIFQAQYPQTFEKKSPASWIREPVNQIASYVHKKLGTFILVAQRNLNNVTVEEVETGRRNLGQIGGKLRNI